MSGKKCSQRRVNQISQISVEHITEQVIDLGTKRSHLFGAQF
jgi:hypothetical protein